MKEITNQDLNEGFIEGCQKSTLDHKEIIAIQKFCIQNYYEDKLGEHKKEEDEAFKGVFSPIIWSIQTIVSVIIGMLIVNKEYVYLAIAIGILLISFIIQLLVFFTNYNKIVKIRKEFENCIKNIDIERKQYYEGIIKSRENIKTSRIPEV